MRGITFSGFFSSSGSASQPSWKSMRQTLSASRCSSTLWPRWNGGSNQNQRSAGKSAFITTSAIRKRSWKTLPSTSRPSMAADRAARAVARRSASRSRSVKRAVGRLDLQRRAAAVRLHRTTLCLQRSSRFGSSRRALDQVLLQVVLLQVDHARALVAGLGQQVEVEHLLGRRRRCGRRSRSRPCRSAARRSPGGRGSPACAWRSTRPREPTLTVSSSSSSSTGRPRCASSMAAARPTGPAPTTTTGRCAGVVGVQLRRPAVLELRVGEGRDASRSALQRLPHLAVALGGPDARVAVLRGLVVGAGHVEGHAVVEDHPAAVLRLQRRVGLAVDGLQVLAGGGAGLDAGVEVGDEVARRLQALAAPAPRPSAPGRGRAPARSASARRCSTASAASR